MTALAASSSRQDRQERLAVGVVERVQALVADQPLRSGEQQPRVAQPLLLAGAEVPVPAADMVEAVGEVVEADAPSAARSSSSPARCRSR